MLRDNWFMLVLDKYYPLYAVCKIAEKLSCNILQLNYMLDYCSDLVQ